MKSNANAQLAPKKWGFGRLLALFACAVLCLGTLPPPALASAPKAVAAHWVGSWGAAPFAPGRRNAEQAFSDGTLRQLVRTSIAGEALRLRISNEFGTEPLAIGAVHVALSAGGAAIQPGSDHALTFNGAGTLSIPPGAYALSDPIAMTTAPFTELAVSLYLPAQQITDPTVHGNSNETSYLVHGNAVSAADLPDPKTFNSWYFLKGVDVETKSDDTATVVAFGDSITDGYGSTLNENGRWPDNLAERLQADKSTRRLSVLDEGIGGNRVLADGTGPSALARFDRDVLAQTGVKYLIILESINDIGRKIRPDDPEANVTAADLEFGLQQMVAKAHEHGILVFGATLTPYQGAKYFTPAGEQVREAINQWIRTSGVFDGVIDFEKAVADPSNPLHFLPAYDHGGHLHANDAGYKAMAGAIDLSLFDRGHSR